MPTAKKVKIVLIGVILALSLAVVIQNTERVEARILFLTIPVSLTFLLAASLLAGYVLGLLTPILWRRATSRHEETPEAWESLSAPASIADEQGGPEESVPEPDSTVEGSRPEPSKDSRNF